MIIENIAITDFRVFSGRHVFDLKPRKKYNKERPIILYGGLNGAGKTTTLMAIRLALYGKQALGHGVSKRIYDDFLAKCIHKSRDTLLQANTSQIELSFSYANMGVISNFTVKRGWINKNNKVTESLVIYEDGKELSELNSEQCQGFLNEIIPIGVSDLFFFDGEKIKDLAIDKDGMALGASIKKLLGLDLIDTLQADLSIYLRNESKKGAVEDIQKEINVLEKDLERAEKNAEKELFKYEECRKSTHEIDAILSRLQNDLSSKGGAWAETREQEIEKETKLRLEKKQLEATLCDIISGSYPISLAGNFAKNTVKQLIEESEYKKSSATAELLKKHLSKLDKTVKKLLDKSDYDKINKAISSEFDILTSSTRNIEIIHDVSDRLLGMIENTIHDASCAQKKTVKDLSVRVSKINDELDKAGKNIARAPEESSIKPIMDSINKKQEERAKGLAKQAEHINNHKKYLRDAIDVARKLDKLSTAHHEDEEGNRVINYANSVKLLLNDFVNEMSQRKVMDLENEFIASFHRLSRKGDTNYNAQIDPKTYLVKLIGENGREIDKNDLSAGEKQIYAIAILEALARTSGRHLPIIIDTPLGRLDSKHRTKLINNYFPHASHQVIILSTDTEVDEKFYSNLSSSISHAYKLDYSGETGAATAKEGYFWKTKNIEATH